MTGRLDGKRIVVFGAGTGIGAATVERLSAEGARVCAADINLAPAEALATRLRSEGREVYAASVDLREEDSVREVVAQAVAQLGGLDGAHVNAADLRIIAQDSNALDEDLAVFDATLAVNLRGHLLCTRAVLPHLLAAGEGAIVYTSSGAAASGEPARPAYAASKGGLQALMRHVASRWGREGITANCVAPGLTITSEMIARGNVTQEFKDAMLAKTPNRRLGRPEDLAGVVAMLLSEDGRWINGQVYHVNGGALMRG
jgi:NAD(P)-dependent dehydrogenase (short-subunit alcohol dehydrogenase family)